MENKLNLSLVAKNKTLINKPTLSNLYICIAMYVYTRAIYIYFWLTVIGLEFAVV